jgi:Uma2 family endonuclease
MAIETRISNEAYERLALAEPDQTWELWNGVLREKPPMTSAHEWLDEKLGFLLMFQLDWSAYQVRTNKGRVRHPEGSYLIPDAFVVPTGVVAPRLYLNDVLEVFEQPLPLVVEIWSRSTGEYDVKEKLAVYQQRGDYEIWYIHPYERTLTAWVRQPDGSYEETLYREGIVSPTSLPGVEIDLAALFEM